MSEILCWRGDYFREQDIIFFSAFAFALTHHPAYRCVCIMFMCFVYALLCVCVCAFR